MELLDAVTMIGGAIAVAGASMALGLQLIKRWKTDTGILIGGLLALPTPVVCVGATVTVVGEEWEADKALHDRGAGPTGTRTATTPGAKQVLAPPNSQAERPSSQPRTPAAQ